MMDALAQRICSVMGIILCIGSASSCREAAIALQGRLAALQLLRD